MVGIVILVLAAPPGALAANPCAACHPGQTAAWGRTNHARSLRPVVDTEFARALPDGPVGEARGGFLLTYTRVGGGLEVTAERGREKAKARIDWAFGAGDQGVTPLAFLDGRWLEHRISYYIKPGRFDLTLGHQPGPSASAATALGVPQPESTLRACLGCHATIAEKTGEVIQPGVECLRCHPGADAHAQGDAPPPARMSAARQVETCANCHRLTPPNGDWNDPLNIRFQPLRLAKSKCYAAGQLACVTCHSPHENARRADPVFYEARCIACHAKPHRPSGCLACHMPKSSPAPYLGFTDHYIRKSRK